MFIRGFAVFALVLGAAQGAYARCAPVENSTLQDQLLNQVRPHIEFTSQADPTVMRLLEWKGPHADYARPEGGYNHTMRDELALYDASFLDCGARYSVTFKPRVSVNADANTFVYNKKTGWLIEVISDESRFVQFQKRDRPGSKDF